MEGLISVGVAILIEALKDRKTVGKYIAAIAKVYVAIERATSLSANWQNEVERQRNKG